MRKKEKYNVFNITFLEFLKLHISLYQTLSKATLCCSILPSSLGNQRGFLKCIK